MNWVSVQDALPESAVGVLVWCKNLRADSVCLLGQGYCAVDRWCIWTDNFAPSFRSSRFLFCEVTHWMPLPKPPEDK